MLQHIALLVGLLFFTSASLAEAPCDFKGISVGDKMSPAELMSALGVTNYKTNPARPSFEHMKALWERYSMLPAAEIVDEEIGPYCDDTSCRIPYGIFVGNMNRIPVKVFISLHDGLITEINVSFGEMYWDEMRPIFDQKYGADWTLERNAAAITNFETKKTHLVQIILLQHLTKGRNLSTNDRCEIWAQNVDVVFEHHDALGPYHSEIVIRLISKNF
jgi:hypothetical protein